MAGRCGIRKHRPGWMRDRAGWYAAADLAGLQDRDWRLDAALQSGLVARNHGLDLSTLRPAVRRPASARPVHLVFGGQPVGGLQGRFLCRRAASGRDAEDDLAAFTSAVAYLPGFSCSSTTASLVTTARMQWPPRRRQSTSLLTAPGMMRATSPRNSLPAVSGSGRPSWSSGLLPAPSPARPQATPAPARALGRSRS